MGGPPFSKTGVEMMSINSFVGLIKDELLKEVS
ncbi:serine/threonine protein kinase, partial [Bacillus pseudomycoides]